MVQIGGFMDQKIRSPRSFDDGLGRSRVSTDYQSPVVGGFMQLPADRGDAMDGIYRLRLYILDA